MFPYIMKNNGSITVFAGGKSHVIDPSHANYIAVKRCIKSGNEDALAEYLDLAKSVQRWSNGQVSVVENTGGMAITFNGKEIHSSLASRMLEMFKDGFDITPLSLFLENVARNPSETSRNELYDFLERCDLPITENGHFLAYKMVRDDYTDIYTGTYSNRIGCKPSMPRNLVDPNRQRTCSEGLHVCSLEYLKNGNYGSSSAGHRVMVVDVDPANVVSFPEDYNFSKGRVWTYEVVGELDWNETIPKNFYGTDSNAFGTDESWDEGWTDDLTDDDETDTLSTSTDYTSSDVWAILDLLHLPDHPTLKKIGEQYGISARQVARIRDGEGPFGDPETEKGRAWQAWKRQHNWA